MHDPLILTRTLRASGDTTRGLERAARSGRLTRVRPGAYVVAEHWAQLDSEARHRIAMDAYAATSRRPVVFAVESAAALLGIPVVGEWPDLPRVIIGSTQSQRARVGVSPRWRDLGHGDATLAGRVGATSLVRTTLDLAAERDLPSGVAAVDHLLRVDPGAGDELRALLARLRPFRGARKVDAALGVATGLAESPLESVSLLRILQLGFDAPAQQVDITVERRRYRVDFFWPEAGVIGEADGRHKYDDPDALWQEKRREDDLRAVSSGFARWDWSDAWRGEPLARRLERAGLRRSTRKASRHALRV